MHIACGDEHLAELFGELCHLQIDGDEVVIRLDIRKIRAALEEVVVVNRLNLEVVVERGNAQQLLLRLMALDGLDELARLAGRADEQAVAILLDNLARQARPPIEILHVRE